LYPLPRAPDGVEVRPARWPQHHEQVSIHEGQSHPCADGGDLVNCQGQQKVQLPLFHLSFVKTTPWRELAENRRGLMKNTCIYRSLKISQTLW